MGQAPDFTLKRRASGILAHITSLAGPRSAGDLGSDAYRFADFLADAGQRWWQMLPVSPVGLGNSPYMSPSAFAGNERLIAVEGRLSAAFRSFEKKAAGDHAFQQFREEQAYWLDDYVLFRALRDAHGGEAWTTWEPGLRGRKPRALASARKHLAGAVLYQEFLQYEFDRQWKALREHCHNRGVGLIGDIPIFVAHDSADVWSHSDIFKLDKLGNPEVVAGVPPDYFAKDGQLWGNPLYRWNVLAERGYDWWLERLRTTFRRFDAVRLDHFIGFHRYWEVPATEVTARNGRYLPGPGARFFAAMFKKLGPLELIAEDLGVLTPEVEALRDKFDLPGMRVLQFAFGGDCDMLPYTYPRRSVVYTGTHDNDTTVGWFHDQGSKNSTRTPGEIHRERELALRYVGTDGREIHWDMIRLALMSAPDTAIFPVQDLLGLGSEARMNTPGTSRGNWAWRLSEGALSPRIAERLALVTETCGRTAERQTQTA